MPARRTLAQHYDTVIPARPAWTRRETPRLIAIESESDSGSDASEVEDEALMTHAAAPRVGGACYGW